MRLPLLFALLASAAAAHAPDPASDGLLVYVGTYTDGGSRGIYRFRFDERTGRLTPDGLAAETVSPSFLASDPKGRLLFAVNEKDTFEAGKSGGVSAFTVDRAGGALALINQVASGGGSPCHLVLDATGRFLLVANYGGSVAVLPVAPDGHLSPVVTRVDPKGKGPDPRRDGSHAHGVYLESGNRLLVPDLGLDQILVFGFDATRGSLTPADPPFAALAPKAGPRHLAFSPDRRFVYIVNELDSTVTTFAWDETRGRLTRGASVSTLPDGYQGETSTAEIAVHPNGRYVYASNRGHDSLAVFAVARDGALSLSAIVPAGGRTPRHFTIVPSGRWLLAAHQGSDTISVFHLDPETGALQPVGDPVKTPRPVSILFLPR